MNSFLKSTLSIASLCLLASCGSSDSGPSNTEAGFTQNETIQADGSNINGAYVAEMYPLNYNLHFKQVGKAALVRDGDSFKAMVGLKYGPKNVEHAQAVYTGRRCPNVNDDLNKDAYIDMREAMIAIGQISIPLDGSLDSQTGGSGQYPTGDATKGMYYYEQSASFERMFADLKAPDTDPTDNIIKLGENDGLTFPGRVVLIQGVHKDLKLPATVMGLEGDSSVHESLPIACGILWKVPELPTDIAPGTETTNTVPTRTRTRN
ncbi:hypothetical protein [Peredibacter starrii]|uniref:Lipoprotein n=1 Tax=Peredibacter starrii TaxID=28202 RepID=A0AAX4HUA3_9BACT|nr:hypothetical protein [Peredibacter starrii]WPU66770.1 hypothetical protein SOO65_08420 [Peredibacter starrii]